MQQRRNVRTALQLQESPQQTAADVLRRRRRIAQKFTPTQRTKQHWRFDSGSPQLPQGVYCCSERCGLLTLTQEEIRHTHISVEALQHHSAICMFDNKSGPPPTFWKHFPSRLFFCLLQLLLPSSRRSNAKTEVEF